MRRRDSASIASRVLQQCKIGQGSAKDRQEGIDKDQQDNRGILHGALSQRGRALLRSNRARESGGEPDT
jgi:hypothetical protein